MSSFDFISRRSFLALAGAAPLALRMPVNKSVPVGIELFSVREGLAKDLMGTVRAVAKLGFEVVEFFSPYYQWTPDYAKEVRKLLDDLGIRCLSTHNSANVLTPDSIDKAIELNQIIGSKSIIMASAGHITTIDGCKKVAEQLTRASEKLGPVGMRTGFHNHKPEFVPIDGQRPMEVLAANTPSEVTLQLDVGTCVDAGFDPVAWIEANPGRIRSIHCKDWGAGTGPDKGYRVLFGEGDSPWKKIFGAAEAKGGVEYYLIEQEGSRFSELETAERCLAAYRKLRA
jgi:sugar phosphate isomerase/epimerase